MLKFSKSKLTICYYFCKQIKLIAIDQDSLKMSTNPQVKCLRLESVKGFDNRVNDIVYSRYCRPSTDDKAVARLVIFFGGDVQDYPERMQAHRDNHRHVQWNLEATSTHLATRFPDSEVFVVRPSRMMLATFSCYDNFVRCSQNGAPLIDVDVQVDSNRGAINHLVKLIDSALTTVRGQHSQMTSNDYEIILIGFSKGCVVVNQLVNEIHEYVDLGRTDVDVDGDGDGNGNQAIRKFLEKTKQIYWLDGGHAGGSNVWITDSKVLKTLAQTGIDISVHVTPYQMEDTNRPWIRHEMRTFVETLKRHGCTNLQQTLHFADQLSSIEMHFKLITEFKSAANSVN